MTKRIEYDFLGLYLSILKDVEGYFPNDHREWERDYATLTRLVSTRGQPTFTVDLPALGKALDRALADGRLVLDGMNLSGSRYPDTKIPRLFWGLWSRLFDMDGCLKKDIDPNVVLFLRTLLYVGKNLEWDCPDRYLYETVKEFYDVESNLPNPSLFWDGDSSGIHSFDLNSDLSLVDACYEHDLFESEHFVLRDVLSVVQQSADRISGILGLPDLENLNFRHGPGATSDHDSKSYKYSFKKWGRRLEMLFPVTHYGLTMMDLEERLCDNEVSIEFEELASRLIAVPKTQKGPRLIAAEPLSHQWIQQGVRDFLYTRVTESQLGLSLDFNSQEHSQVATLEGSKTGSISTIDLKSASDRMSCWLVERIFRKNPPLLEAFASCRTRYLTNEIDRKSPKLVKLRKFSTQGSALTFPVQSIVFLAICVGVGRHLTGGKIGWSELFRSVRVFGDDIIVPKEWEPLTTRVLEALYLKVNRTKTFSNGFFRESCGMDAYKGYDVTPAHVTMSGKEPTARAIASNVAVSNNFFKKGLWHTADWVRSTVQGGHSVLVVNRSSGAFGFVTNCTKPVNSAKTRWNQDTHKWELRGLSIWASARNKKQDAASALLQYFTEDPSPHINYESGIAVAGVPRKRHAWVPVELLG